MMTIDQHIEELRAELKGCNDSGEIAQLEAELEAALEARAELDHAFYRTLR